MHAELDKLVLEGILTPIQHANWAAPIVPVMQADRRSSQICGEFINKASLLDKYPILKIEDLFFQLSGGQKFTTKLDLDYGMHSML